MDGKYGFNLGDLVALVEDRARTGEVVGLIDQKEKGIWIHVDWDYKGDDWEDGMIRPNDLVPMTPAPVGQGREQLEAWLDG